MAATATPAQPTPVIEVGPPLRQWLTSGWRDLFDRHHWTTPRWLAFRIRNGPNWWDLDELAVRATGRPGLSVGGRWRLAPAARAQNIHDALAAVSQAQRLEFRRLPAARSVQPQHAR
ncbi:hypothetical protein ACFOSC_26620 [Streptantibioticus rubrisoli]|uniref:Uncharacterized protein n=1 Tax=Streptantibioticus rubrisoli TaxID=1387313 RepID=A0ABT1PES4_9ACTN|nr:hypothetical protein [Streptantibioticus rubrisoli]MCQ4043851.1 hypothetical protein [Streptantibioticus rubrisoli]